MLKTTIMLQKKSVTWTVNFDDLDNFITFSTRRKELIIFKM